VGGTIDVGGPEYTAALYPAAYKGSIFLGDYATGDVRRALLDASGKLTSVVGFASGLAYGFLEGKGPQAAVEYGAAHGALAMTTPGDTSMVNVAEVEAVMKGKGARVIR